LAQSALKHSVQLRTLNEKRYQLSSVTCNTHTLKQSFIQSYLNHTLYICSLYAVSDVSGINLFASYFIFIFKGNC